MEFRNRQSFVLRLLTAALGIGCVLGALFGLLNGYFLLALSQVVFAAAMVMILFGMNTRGGTYRYLVWACLGAGILLTAVASAS